MRAAHFMSATARRSIAQPAAEGADTRAQQPEVFALVARCKGAPPRDARAPLEAVTTYANSLLRLDLPRVKSHVHTKLWRSSTGKPHTMGGRGVETQWSGVEWRRW
jgi:hypothetical protein